MLADRYAAIPPGVKSVRGGIGFDRPNSARTELTALTLTMQVAVAPEQSPPHPTNVDSVPGVTVAVSMTDVADTKVSVQSAPQLMPVPVTDPSPSPVLNTLSVWAFAGAPVRLAAIHTTATNAAMRRIPRPILEAGMPTAADLDPRSLMAPPQTCMSSVVFSRSCRFLEEVGGR
jgi:hypothetical protein